MGPVSSLCGKSSSPSMLTVGCHTQVAVVDAVLPVPAAFLKLPSVLSSNACQWFEEFPTVFDPGKSE